MGNLNVTEQETDLKAEAPVIQIEAVLQEEPYKSGSVQYIDSREVAKIVGKDHRKLLRDIRRYNTQLDETNFGHISMFWTESTYADSYGRTQKCYLVTKKGCEFIAHKLTGEKGTLFTATYINRFHEMEDALAGREDAGCLSDTMREYMVCQENQNEKMAEAINALAELSRRMVEGMKTLSEKMENLESRGKIPDPENPFTFQFREDKLSGRMRKRNRLVDQVVELYGGSRKRVLHHMYSTLQDRLGVSLDAYLHVVRKERGNEDIGTLHVVAGVDRFYEAAVSMNEFAIERKKIYG